MRNTRSVSFLRGCAITVALIAAVLGLGRTARADIIDEWVAVAVPAAPALKPVTARCTDDRALDARLLAVELRDFTALRRVVAEGESSLLDSARAAKALVIYTEYPPNTMASVLPQVAPLGSEPNIISVADKFIDPNLDQLLKAKGIKTVLIVGVVANGAVLYTASDAAQRGYKVVVAVDGMSGMSPFAEAYTATQLTTAPTVANNVTLTRTGMVKF